MAKTDTTDQAADAPKKKGGIGKILLGAVAAAVLVGAGFGAGYVYFGQRIDPSQQVQLLIDHSKASGDAAASAAEGPKKVTKPTPKGQEFVTTYYEFPDPLTTNLKNSRQILQLKVGISTQYDKRVITNIKENKLALTSDILAVMGSFARADVEGKAGHDKLADAIKVAMNDRLKQLAGFGGVEHVYFSSFILQ